MPGVNIKCKKKIYCYRNLKTVRFPRLSLHRKILLSTGMIHYTCRHSRGLWAVVEGVIMDCCSENRQEGRQNCILMPQHFKDKLKQFQKGKKLSRKMQSCLQRDLLRAESLPDHSLESGLRVRKKIIEDPELKFHFQNLSFPDFTLLCLLSLFLRKDNQPWLFIPLQNISL